MNKEDKNINIFKKSIESTVKAVSNKPDISILFGTDKKNSHQDVNLPEIDKANLRESKLNIRGKSDSASLIQKYHDSKIHKRMCPKKLETKEIFDEIEFLRCELLGSLKYPGIKKNLFNYDQEIIRDKINNVIFLYD